MGYGGRRQRRQRRGRSGVDGRRGGRGIDTGSSFFLGWSGWAI
jgi:hypothetical protein